MAWSTGRSGARSGAIPTLRKSYTYPHEESATAFALNGFKFIVGIAALGSYSLATWLFPATVLLVNGAIIALLLTRRNQLNPRQIRFKTYQQAQT